MDQTPVARPAPATEQRPDPVTPAPTAPTGAAAESDTDTRAAVTKAFSTSMVVSGIRCLLAYIVFPWLLPLFGVAKGMGPAVGLAVGVVAIGFNIASIRRFMRSGHRYRYWIATINVAVIGMLSVLVVRDIGELVG